MEVAKRRALGRGLGALIPGAFEPNKPSEDSSLVPLAAIQPSRVQPRQMFAESAIDDLANSIREKGILQPLLVRPSGDGYELIAGERRFRAAHKLALEKVPVIIRAVDDREALELALIENIQRENLNPIEEARAYRRLSEDFHLAHDQIAQRVGKDRSTVSNALRLLQLPDEVVRKIESGELSAGHARTLINLSSTEQTIDLANSIVAQRLNVRQAEKLAKQTRVPAVDADLRAAENLLTEHLGTKVRIATRRNGAGRIEIEYYSLDQLNGLIDRLGT